jgi:hypothetical protein
VERQAKKMVAGLSPVPDQTKSALLRARRHGNSFFGASGAMEQI